jgi:hypothetical protein
MKIITLPCYNITIRFGIDEGESDEARSARDLGVDADLHVEWPEANIKEGDVAWQDAYRNCLMGIEHLILEHARAGVDVRSPEYVQGLQAAVTLIQDLYKFGAECYGNQDQLPCELPSGVSVSCLDFVTAKDFVHKLMLQGRPFSFRYDEATKQFVVTPND